MIPDLPLGAQIAAGLVVGVGVVLSFIWRRVSGQTHSAGMPSDQVQVDLRPALDRLDALEHHIGEMFDQHERAMAQRFDSLARETQRQIAEKDREDRRQFDRLHDKLDRLRNGH